MCIWRVEPCNWAAAYEATENNNENETVVLTNYYMPDWRPTFNVSKLFTAQSQQRGLRAKTANENALLTRSLSPLNSCMFILSIVTFTLTVEWTEVDGADTTGDAWFSLSTTGSIWMSAGTWASAIKLQTKRLRFNSKQSQTWNWTVTEM